MQFYAPVLFESLASGSLGGLLNTVIINAVNVLATFIAVGFVDKWGRRALLIGTAAWMFVMQIIVAVVLAVEFGKYGESSSPGCGCPFRSPESCQSWDYIERLCFLFSFQNTRRSCGSPENEDCVDDREPGSSFTKRKAGVNPTSLMQALCSPTLFPSECSSSSAPTCKLAPCLCQPCPSPQDPNTRSGWQLLWVVCIRKEGRLSGQGLTVFFASPTAADMLEAGAPLDGCTPQRSSLWKRGRQAQESTQPPTW